MIGGMPPLQWLQTFRAVMEAGSFAGAAKLLNLTPSAISHQMRALEGMLGRQLFLRVRRSVVPTEEALTYSASIGESFARLMTATIRVASGAGVRRLPIHASPSFATLWLMPRLGQFLREHPSIDVALFASHEPARLGQDGILIDIQYARPVPEDCEAVALGEELIVPLASPAFVAAHGLEAPGRHRPRAADPVAALRRALGPMGGALCAFRPAEPARAAVRPRPSRAGRGGGRAWARAGIDACRRAICWPPARWSCRSERAASASSRTA